MFFASLPNYDMPADTGGNNRYEMTIEATDGTNTATPAVIVDVTDVNEEPDLVTVHGGMILVPGPEWNPGIGAGFSTADGIDTGRVPELGH